MSISMLFFLALGLSMDAFAVSLSNGMCYRNIGRKQMFYTALTFGLFQAGMPIIGYFAGRFFSSAIAFLDHWFALVLLGVIGGNMIVEAIKEIRHPESCGDPKPFTLKVLLVQGVATSIDALAVGISLAVMQTNIVVAASFIGAITFLCCLVGAAIGKRFGARLQHKARILGGVILVGIGLKVFIEHMMGA